MPLTGKAAGAVGVPTGDGATGGLAAGADDAAGELAGPGWVPGAAPGGLVPAAGWALLPWPSTSIPLGVNDGDGEPGGAGAEGGVATPPEAAGGCGAGVAMGPAGAGFFRAISAIASSIARSIGIRTLPLFLSTQA